MRPLVLPIAPRRAPPRESALALVPWRLLVVVVTTVAALGALSLVGAPYAAAPWLWLLLFGAEAAWLTYAALHIIVDMFDDGQSEGRGLAGLVRYIDTYVAREMAVANLFFLFFLFPRGDYGRFFEGLEVYDAVAPLVGGAGASVWVVYQHILNFWIFTTVSTGLDYCTPHAAWVRLIVLLAFVSSFLIFTLVVIVGVVESLAMIKEAHKRRALEG